MPAGRKTGAYRLRPSQPFFILWIKTTVRPSVPPLAQDGAVRFRLDVTCADGDIQL